MKTTTKLALGVLVFALTPTLQAAVSPGSYQGTGMTLYNQHYGTDAKNPSGRTLDCKIVSYGDKTVIWTRQSGNVAGDTWASQFRVYSAPGKANKTEYNLLGRSANNKETFGNAKVITLNSVLVSLYQSDNNEMYETDLFDYYVAKANTPIDGDKTAPVMGNCTVENIASLTAVLNMSATDANDIFYIVRDLSKGIKEITLNNTLELKNLNPDTEYNMEIIPVDFSGNEGTPKVVTFTTRKFSQINTGVAKEIRFVLVSTKDKLEYYYEFADGVTLFHEAFLKYSIDGGATFKEVKPVVSPDRLSCYGTLEDKAVSGKLLTLNMGYMAYQSGGIINWEKYVVTNTQITEGPLKGSPIMHQMGELSQGDVELPVIRTVKLADVTTDYCSLTVDGQDNSGVVYYEVLFDNQKANLFRTGTSSFTGLTPGKTHILKVLAKDLSGNASTDTLDVKVRTTIKRTGVGNNERLGYNSATKPTGKGGEIATIITYDADKNELVLGCTTQNGLLQDNRQAAFFLTADESVVANKRPVITINNVDYVMNERHVTELDNLDGITTAMITFAGKIGETELTPGMTFTLKWNVTWAENTGGRFSTAPFEYVVGDDGRADVTPPTKPELVETDKGTENYKVSWNACTDDLLGVKGYEVVINKNAPYLIFNFEEESYEIFPASGDKISVTAIDYAGNRSEVASIETKGMDDHIDVNASAYISSGQLIISGAAVRMATVYAVGGEIVAQGASEKVDVSALSPGVYIVKVIDRNGQIAVMKVLK